MEPVAAVEQDQDPENEWFIFKNAVNEKNAEIESLKGNVWENLDDLKDLGNPSEILEKYLEKNCFTGFQILSLIELWEESRSGRSGDSESIDTKSDETTIEFSDSEHYTSMAMDLKEDVIMESCKNFLESLFPGSSLNCDCPFLDESEEMSEFVLQQKDSELTTSLSSESSLDEDSPTGSVSKSNNPSRSVSSKRSESPSAIEKKSPPGESSQSQSTSRSKSSAASAESSTHFDSESGCESGSTSDDSSVPKSFSKSGTLFVTLPPISKDDPLTPKECKIPSLDRDDLSISKECANNKIFSNEESSQSKENGNYKKCNEIIPIFYKVKLEEEDKGSKQENKFTEKGKKCDIGDEKKKRDENVNLADEKKGNERKRSRNENQMHQVKEKINQENPTNLVKTAKNVRKMLKRETFAYFMDKQIKDRKEKEASAKRSAAVEKSRGKDDNIRERIRQELIKLKKQFSKRTSDQEDLKQTLIEFTKTMLKRYDKEMKAFYKQLVNKNVKYFTFTDKKLCELQSRKITDKNLSGDARKEFDEQQAREILIIKIGINVSGNFRCRQIFTQELITLLYKLVDEDTDISDLAKRVIAILNQPSDETGGSQSMYNKLMKRFIKKKSESTETLATVEEIEQDIPKLEDAGTSRLVKIHSEDLDTDSTPMVVGTEEVATTSNKPLDSVVEDSAGMDVSSSRSRTPENLSSRDGDRNPLLSPPKKKSKSDDQ